MNDTSNKTATVAPPKLEALHLQRGAQLGRYVVMSTLGEGGMGVVYAAFDPELDRKVAVKLLQGSVDVASTPAYSAPAGTQAWLFHEAQAMAKLNHPNVVTVHDVGTLDGNRVFIAMELVEGQTLRAWLKSGKKTTSQILDVFRAAGGGLAAAHRAGLIHRDFKPDNVMLGADGRVRVMDFGLAGRAAVPAADLPKKTLIGTPAYIAPELYKGQAADARVDVFAFGISLYEALYGEKPFPTPYLDRSPEARWALPAVPKGSQVPLWLRRIVVKALAEAPEARFSSMAEVLAELDKDPAILRKRLALGLAAALSLLAVGIGVHHLSSHSDLCKGASLKIAGVWDDARREQMHQAFLSTGQPFAADSWERVRGALENYIARWTNLRTDACEATQFRGEQPAEVMSLRITCLDGQFEYLKALTNVLVTANADAVEKAIGAVHALPELSVCSDVTSLRSQVQLPVDAQAQAAIAQVRSELAQATTLFRTGNLDEAKKSATHLAARAETIDFKPLQAQVEELEGHIVYYADPAEAEEHFFQAMFAAQVGRDDHLAAEAALDVLSTNASAFLRGDVQRNVQIAKAAVARLGNTPRLRAKLLGVLSRIDCLKGNNERAMQQAKEAIELQERNAADADELLLVDLYNDYGIASQRAMKVSESASSYQRALNIAEKVYGLQHPQRAFMLMNLGTLLTDDSGEFERSLDFSERAAAIFLATHDGADYAGAELNVGEALRGRGRLPEAKDRFELALKGFEKALGHDSPPTALALEDLGTIFVRERNYPVALRYFQEALDILKRLKQEDSNAELNSVGYTGLSRALLGLNERSKGLTAAQRAYHLQEDKQLPFATTAPTRFALAMALRATGKDNQRALSMANDAATQFRQIHWRLDEEEVNKWLEAHSQ